MNIPHEIEWKEYELFDLQNDTCVIYILYDQQDKIIYIGRTQSFSLRMGQHKIEKKNVKKVRYFITRQEFSEDIEGRLIKFYDPDLNNQKNSKEKVDVQITDEPITKEDFKNFIYYNNIDISFVIEKCGYNENYLNAILDGRMELKKRTADRLKLFMIVYPRYLEDEQKNGKVKADDFLKGE